MGTSVTDLTRARRLERLMVRVRWFGAVLGVYLVSQTNSGAPPHASDRILAFAYALALSFRSVGFLPATAAYLFLSGVALGPLECRRLTVLAVFAIAAAVVLDLLFRKIFKLDLT